MHLIRSANIPKLQVMNALLNCFQHHHIGYTSLTEGPKLIAKEEEKRDFAVSFSFFLRNQSTGDPRYLDLVFAVSTIRGPENRGEPRIAREIG